MNTWCLLNTKEHSPRGWIAEADLQMDPEVTVQNGPERRLHREECEEGQTQANTRSLARVFTTALQAVLMNESLVCEIRDKEALCRE